MHDVIWLGMWIRFLPDTLSAVHPDVRIRAHEVNGKTFTTVFPCSVPECATVEEMMDQYSVLLGDVEALVERQHEAEAEAPGTEAHGKCQVPGWVDRDCYYLLSRYSKLSGSINDLPVLIFPVEPDVAMGYDEHAKQHMIDMIVKGETP